MGRQMVRSSSQADVLVLGDHPAAYLAAILLRQSEKLRIWHSTIPGEKSEDRLVVVNPRFYSLHKLLEPLRRKIDRTAVYGLQFLGEQPGQSSEFRAREAVVAISSYQQIRDALAGLAQRHGVRMIRPQSLEIGLPDEQGMEVVAGSQSIHARMLVIAGELSQEQRRPLGIAEGWDIAIMRRYSSVSIPDGSAVLTGRPTMPMSLNLNGFDAWGWMLPGDSRAQLAVQQPLTSVGQVNPRDLLRHWAEVLSRHGLLRNPDSVPLEQTKFIDLPAAGALEVEGVVNRALLAGPAGGFYSAGGEDIYPNCWSVVHAADVIHKALKQKHLQDALQPYRDRWRTTLGDYLRGPQQNLHFLLPLVYRNQIMTNRLGESILQGKSVVR